LNSICVYLESEAEFAIVGRRLPLVKNRPRQARGEREHHTLVRRVVTRALPAGPKQLGKRTDTP
jgi:hypothetical protein